MKTADEWMNELPLHSDRSFIRAIQLDAYKAGMSEAAEIGMRVTKVTNGGAWTKDEIVKSILHARDNKTIL